jgi:multidrug transporter EmrE-like cation transporter
MGTALVAIIGLWFFQEAITIIKVVALGLITVGVVMLRFTSSESY